MAFGRAGSDDETPRQSGASAAKKGEYLFKGVARERRTGGGRRQLEQQGGRMRCLCRSIGLQGVLPQRPHCCSKRPLAYPSQLSLTPAARLVFVGFLVVVCVG